MTSLTFYSGVGEIGGNKILLEDNGTRVFLDFGTRMGFSSGFFSEFLGARKNTELKDKIAIGALPKISGIYRNGMIKPEGLNTSFQSRYKRVLGPDSALLSLNGVDSYEKYLIENNEAFLDAVLLSHAHLDHSGDIGYIHPSVPLFCSKETGVLVQAIDEITTFKSNALASKSNRVSENGERSFFPGSPKIVKDGVERGSRLLDDLETASIGDMKITLIGQDHSVPGAASFLIEASGKRILYTGDIRFHGTYPMTVSEYAKKIGMSVDVMICEGTRIDSKRTITEEEIKENIYQGISETRGLVFIDFSWKDTTRFETILDAAKRAGRIFVINARLAYLLDRLGKYPKDEGVKVFLKRKDSCLYSPGDYKNTKHELGLSVNWKEDGVDTTHYDRGVTALDLASEPGKYVMMLSFFDLNQIFDLADSEGNIDSSRFIRAQCEPFSDEMELDEERFINWLEKFGVQFAEADVHLPDGCSNTECNKIRRRMDRSHVSGHASGHELINLINTINPKKLFPIHTEKSGLFKELLKGSGIEIVEPVVGKTYQL